MTNLEVKVADPAEDRSLKHAYILHSTAIPKSGNISPMSDETFINVPGFGLPMDFNEEDVKFASLDFGDVKGHLMRVEGTEFWTWTVEGRKTLSFERAKKEMRAAMDGGAVIEQRDSRGHLVQRRKGEN